MKVLIVCEDPTHDQYIVKPIVQKLFDDLGKTVSADVLTDPHLRGIDDLLAQINDIFADNQMVDIFVVVVDNDCGRQSNAARIANAIATQPKAVACLAIEEVETWMLCLHDAVLPEPWSKIRADCDVKEHFALPFLETQGFGG